MDKVKFFMGLEDYDEEEVYEEEVTSEVSEDIASAPFINNQKNNKILNIHTSSQIKLVVNKPKDFDESAKIVDQLKSRRPVVLNLEETEGELARKIFDFCSGALYALDGQIQKVSKNIFVLAPSNVDIDNAIKDEFKRTGIYPWSK